jgi:hypothetical protein
MKARDVLDAGLLAKACVALSPRPRSPTTQVRLRCGPSFVAAFAHRVQSLR